jgi:hypothetical protein
MVVRLTVMRHEFVVSRPVAYPGTCRVGQDGRKEDPHRRSGPVGNPVDEPQESPATLSQGPAPHRRTPSSLGATWWPRAADSDGRHHQGRRRSPCWARGERVNHWMTLSTGFGGSAAHQVARTTMARTSTDPDPRHPTGDRGTERLLHTTTGCVGVRAASIPVADPRRSGDAESVWTGERRGQNRSCRRPGGGAPLARRAVGFGETTVDTTEQEADRSAAGSAGRASGTRAPAADTRERPVVPRLILRS